MCCHGCLGWVGVCTRGTSRLAAGGGGGSHVSPVLHVTDQGSSGCGISVVTEGGKLSEDGISACRRWPDSVGRGWVGSGWAAIGLRRGIGGGWGCRQRRRCLRLPPLAILVRHCHGRPTCRQIGRGATIGNKIPAGRGRRAHRCPRRGLAPLPQKTVGRVSKDDDRAREAGTSTPILSH